MFLLGQYRGHQMAIRTLVTSLQNMFDSREKEGLFTEIDQLIFTEDISVYNSLVFQSGQLFERFIESTNKNQERCATTDNRGFFVEIVSVGIILIMFGYLI